MTVVVKVLIPSIIASSSPNCAPARSVRRFRRRGLPGRIQLELKARTDGAVAQPGQAYRSQQSVRAVLVTARQAEHVLGQV